MDAAILTLHPDPMSAELARVVDHEGWIGGV